MSERAVIGIIGGSGLYEMEGFTRRARGLAVETPFGAPSDGLLLGALEGQRVAFLPRHGRGHRILPHEINFRANIYAMKKLGRGVHPLGLGGRLAEGSLRAARHGGPRPVHRPHAAARARPSSAAASSRTSAFAHPFCPRAVAGLWPRPAGGRGDGTTRAAPTSASRGRSSRRAPSRELYRSWGVPT